ncbi:hypothetical protein HDV01_000693 [Terramyces sp. JEL0728]|nr:hypothetical protein HDV01_000693 [Terramyces sp. JEL0728]
MNPIVSDLPKRPDNGGVVGKNIRVAVNVFPILQISSSDAFQYDVQLTPDVPPEKAKRAFRQAEEIIRKSHPNAWFVFDGQRNAYSLANIDNQTFEIVIPDHVEVDIPDLPRQENRGGRGGFRGGRGGHTQHHAPLVMDLKPAVVYTKETVVGKSITLKFVMRKTATINLHELLLFAKGKCTESENVLHAATALSVVLRHIPSMLFTPVGSNFFSPIGRTPISGGLEVWRGYHQSVRSLMAGHLGINIDIAATVFRKGNMPLLDYLMEVLNCRNENDLARIPSQQLDKACRGVNCITTHRGDQKQRFSIKRLSKDSALSMRFEKDGKQISVADYFQDEFNLRLRYPNLPLALKGNGKTAFPLECLSIQPAQRVKEKLNGTQTSDMIRATVQRPSDRRKQIEDAVTQSLKYNENPYMKSFGVKVEPKMMEIQSRILPAPKVLLGDNQALNGQDGSWNMRNQRLVDTPLMDSFAFVFFTKVSSNDAKEVKDTVLRKWKQYGMNIASFDCPVLVANPNSETNVKGALMQAFHEATKNMRSKCKIIMCIVENNGKQLYEQIKRATLCEGGIVTQVMVGKHVLNARNIKDQYICNVAMKANIKLGGGTNYIDHLLFKNDGIMFCGADVTHASPGSSAPSIAAVVATTDREAIKYNTYCRAQMHRQALIQDLESIMDQALADYKKANRGALPKRIVFFRDGVASGQFKEVREIEIAHIKEAMAKAKCTAQLSLIVVQKRHHIRLFPVDNNQDRSGNCCSGTVIDSNVVHPTEFNFILQSHSGLQGMSRPTIYHVLYDEAKMTSDECQQLCYNLCFLSERATRTISIVAPAYRAQLAAYCNFY